MPAYQASDSSFVSISDADRSPDLDYAVTVHHGVDADGLPFNPRRGEILGGAAARLHPIDFDEPFGLSIVESLICGTPVIAYPRGALPDIVDEGITGRLVRDIGQAVAAVHSIHTVDRAGCRSQARERFGADRMVAGYPAVYERLIGDSRR
ncbi:glycosyltransferase [Paractinoplanes brasiliensis]|uniref:glycosyltransferase n=1 Tax=Paractinoplanes brasiliensis TaxID=52695 RepID=UPI001A42A600|nr:glycosyltransferase [Actinoplanes brasiliensis]GID29890.1 hypothetical protein Abr02nite_48730 [Actinoplanes brasiliensis]